MKYSNVCFRDSLNFFHTKLANLPKMFGIANHAKGYFPHVFNKKQNYNYNGRLPAIHYYGANSMDTSEREKFLTWYNEQSTNNFIFNFKNEISKYCKSDVEILRKACLKFRKMFVDLLSVDPLAEVATIVSACMKAFRTNFLEPDVLALMTFKSYRMRNRQSEMAVRYICYLEKKYGVQFQSAYRGTEKQFGKYLVDAYHPNFPMNTLENFSEFEDQTLVREMIVEIHGCYFDGCKVCFPQRASQIMHNKESKEYSNMDMLYKNTQKKMGFLRNLPGKPYIIEVWECEIYEQCGRDADLKVCMLDEKIITPIYTNREAFFGGRTENFYRYYKCGENEKIRYIDVNSLYPYVNKYGTYPIGHPEILLGADIPANLDGITGIAKVRILPPKDLYLPVLPIKTNNKLIFALCRTCADQENSSNCNHTDEQREITGTYTCIELRKAVEKNYVLLNIYEVWSYRATKYDKATQQGGIFTKYIDTFVKIKQEASGFPENVVTYEQKSEFIEKMKDREGLILNVHKIKPNPGLRSLSKLCLNSLWGKFGQRNAKQQTSVIVNSNKFYQLLAHPAVEITDIMFLNEHTSHVSWTCNCLRLINQSLFAYIFIYPRYAAQFTDQNCLIKTCVDPCWNGC